LENGESFGILSSTIAEEMSVFEGILSLTWTVSHELTSLFLFPAFPLSRAVRVELLRFARNYFGVVEDDWNSVERSYLNAS
jgi:hypothetical protein